MVALPSGTDVLVFLASAVAIHRVWLFEDLTSPVRRIAERASNSIAKLLHKVLPPEFAAIPHKLAFCPPCFGFWASALAAVLWWADAVPIVHLFRLSLVGFLLIRVVLWLQSSNIIRSVHGIPGQSGVPPDSLLAASLVQGMKSAGLMPGESCGAKAKNGPVALPAAPDGTTFAPAASINIAKPVLIMAPLVDFSPAYSVVTCMLDHYRAMDAAGLSPLLVVSQGCNLKEAPAGIRIAPIIPSIVLQEDVVDEASTDRLVIWMQTELAKLRPRAIVAHDTLFVTWYLTFAAAIHRFAKVASPDLRTIPWFHVAHSCTSARPHGAPLRCTLPVGPHFLIALSPSERTKLADYYVTTLDRVELVQNLIDVPHAFGLDPIARAIADKADLWSADIVQVYPVSTPRMGANGKGLPLILQTLAELARRSYDVRLIVTNAHADGNDALIKEMQDLATSLGIGSKVLFTSEHFPNLRYSVPHRVVVDLMRLANLFLFPSVSEASPLILLEAAAAGNLLVLNSEVPGMADLIPHQQAKWYPLTSMAKKDMVDVAPIANHIEIELHVGYGSAQRHVFRYHSVASRAQTWRNIFSRVAS